MHNVVILQMGRLLNYSLNQCFKIIPNDLILEQIHFYDTNVMILGYKEWSDKNNR